MVFSNIGDQNLEVKGTYLNVLAAMDLITPDRDMENKLRQWADIPDLPDDIYDNYDERVTAQTQAQPLTVAGPGQDPNAPPSTGQPLVNPKTGLPQKTAFNKPGSKKKGDQTNVQTVTNRKKDGANKPTPVNNAANRKAAIDEFQDYRNDLINRILADAPA